MQKALQSLAERNIEVENMGTNEIDTRINEVDDLQEMQYYKNKIIEAGYSYVIINNRKFVSVKIYFGLKFMFEKYERNEEEVFSECFDEMVANYDLQS